MANRGKKFDQGKSRVDLIPSDVLLSVGDVLGYGAEKYGELNWTAGLNFSRLEGAALRHLLAFKAGIDYDKESKLHHIDHTITNLIMLKHLFNTQKHLDDRWESNDQKQIKKHRRESTRRNQKTVIRKQKLKATTRSVK